MKTLITILLLFLVLPWYTAPAPTVPTMLLRVDNQQLACVAKGVFFEAAGETLVGQAAVARVILNRVKLGFAKTPCGVVYQSAMVDRLGEMVKVCQFSWVCNGVKDPSPKDPAYVRAKDIAYDVVINDAYADVVTDRTAFFHTVDSNPGWGYRKVTTIGNHIFYAQNSVQKTAK